MRGFLLLACSVIWWMPCLRVGNLIDDGINIYDNPRIDSLYGLWQIWFTNLSFDYLPMTWSMFWVEWHLFGHNPLGYHVVNLFLHLLGVLLVWDVLSRLEVPAAWWVALLYAIHPVNTQTVAWISEGKNTLSLVFYAASMAWYLRARQTTSRGLFAWSWFAYALGLLSKVSGATMPAILLALAWWKQGRVRRRDVLEVAPYAALAVLAAVTAVWYQQNRAIGLSTVPAVPGLARLEGTGWIVWFYLQKIVAPAHLCFFYPRWYFHVDSVLQWMPLLGLIVLFGLLWHGRAELGRGPFCGLLVFLLLLLPVLGFVDMYYHRYSLVADQWQYLAMLGILPLAGVLLRSLTRREAALLGASLWVVLGCCTWMRCEVFADPMRLWTEVTVVNPDCSVGWNNVGLIMQERGDDAGAFKAFEKGARIAQQASEAFYNLGNAWLKVGDRTRAVACFLESIRQSDGFSTSRYMSIERLADLGYLDEAARQWQLGLSKFPDDGSLHYQYGRTLLKMGEYRASEAEFRAALEIDPSNALYLAMLEAVSRTLGQAARKYTNPAGRG
jgi:tetratricopeptide (TPR) repeat protein